MSTHSPTTAYRGAVVTPLRIIDDGLVVVARRRIAWVGTADEAERAGWGGLPERAVRAPAGSPPQPPP